MYTSPISDNRRSGEDLMDELSMASSSDNSSRTSEESLTDVVAQKNIWDRSHVRLRQANFYAKIHEYYLKEAYTDVKITCGDQKSFTCHRLALAAVSEYFHDTFRKRPDDRVFFLHDIDSHTFQKILKFVYGGKVPAIYDDNILSLLGASNILRLSVIEDHCVHYLTQQNIPMDCALQIFYFASAYKKKSLISTISKFILRHLNHFRHEIEFPRMSLEDFNLLLTYFQASSASQEASLLNVILQWVRSWTDIPEKRKSTFENLARNVRFEFVSATQVAEYFARCSVNVGRPREGLDLFNSDFNGMEIDSDVSLHVYLETTKKESSASNLAERTRIFSLRQESCSSLGINWHLSHTLSLPIKKMRIVESDGRLYCLKVGHSECTFSSSAAIDLSDERMLAPPVGLMSTSLEDLAVKVADRLTQFSLCSLRKNIYLNGLHSYIGLQCYDTELGGWCPLPLLSDNEPAENILCDDTRLYVLYPRFKSNYPGCYQFAAYDPRVGKLSRCKGLNDIEASCVEPGVYHKGRIYVPESDMKEESSTFRMAIYDPAADRWDVRNLKSRSVLYGLGRRLVSFKDHIWMFGVDNPAPLTHPSIYIQTYDSFLQTWETKYSRSLEIALSCSELEFTNFMDVIAFKSS